MIKPDEKIVGDFLYTTKKYLEWNLVVIVRILRMLNLDRFAQLFNIILFPFMFQIC